MKKIANPSNLLTALQQVVSNGGSPGIDGMTVKGLREWFSSHYRTLSCQLIEGRYLPEPVKGVEIPKPQGGFRQLGIPTAKDRLVQQAISQVLTRYYDPEFSESSYGFRPLRGAHGAIKQASSYIGEGYSHIVDIDLAKFFDEVNHDRLLWLLGTGIGDRGLLKLIGRFLRSGMLQGGLVSQRTKGTPQGSPLSPLLSNIVLDELDKELERRGHRFVRYADDMIMFMGSEQAAQRVQGSVTRFIEDRLKLKVNREKSGIRRPHELTFLGFSFQRNGGATLNRKSEKKLKEKIRQLTRRNRGISFEQMVSELNRVLRGWLNYFRIAAMKAKMQQISGWLRRRLRCFRLKQCKRAIGMARFLMGLGIAEWRSWLVAGSSKGWYCLSMTNQVHEAMNLAWFKKIGLYDLFTNYCSYLEETARYGVRMPGGVRGL